MMNFRPLTASLGLVLAAALLPACSTTEQAAETATPGATPTEVRTDADRRAIYNNGNQAGTGSAVPDATPNRVRLGEQAAEINRQQRIENTNTNDPNTTTPETRLRRLGPDLTPTPPPAPTPKP